MVKIHRVANHLRYMRSNIMVVVISFTFTIGAVLAAQAFVRAGNVLANDYNHQQYNSESRHGCYDYQNHCSPYPTHTPTHSPKPTYSPYPTYTPKPTHTPQPTHHPQPSFICTWMKATISGKTVSLTAQSNVSGHGQVVGYRYDFGDGYVANSSGALSHTYSNYATYNTKAWIQYKYHGKLYWTQQCTLIVKVLAPHSPHPTYTPHPTYKPHPTYSPQPTYKPQPTYQPAPSQQPAPVYNNNTNNNSNVNNNNSSAVANVYLTKSDGGSSSVVPAGYSGHTSAVYGDMPMELPKTGAEDTILGFVGLGGLVTAATAYAMSRRELTDAFLKRN
jgi:LPXTG-motif cell wall-anchored protein